MPREILKAEKFEALATIENQPGIGNVMVGQDLRLYRKTYGLLEMIIPCEPIEKTEPGLWFGKLRRTDYPSMADLAHLFDTFLSKYDREVMFVVGRRYDNKKFFYMIPSQIGTAGGIEWKDSKGMDWFSTQARFLGTVHVHPGNSCDPSGPDLNHWKEKRCSGIHVIFGRDQSFTMSASVAGHVVSIARGTVKGLKRIEVPLCTSLNRKLKELLLVPKPVKIIPYRGKHWGGRAKTWKRNYQREGEYREWLKRNQPEDHLFDDLFGGLNPSQDLVVANLLESGAVDIPVAGNSCPDKLWIVKYAGGVWVMTTYQYASYRRRAGESDNLAAPIGYPIDVKGMI